MKHKRISRHELIQENKTAKRKLRMMADSLTACEEKYKELEKRFISIAQDTTEVSIGGSPVRTITAEVKTYGQYATMPRDAHLFDSEILEEVKGQLVASFAEGLLEQNMVKIVVKPDLCPFVETMTVAAKMYVIPWEQMNRLNHPRVIQCKIGREKHG